MSVKIDYVQTVNGKQFYVLVPVIEIELEDTYYAGLFQKMVEYAINKYCELFSDKWPDLPNSIIVRPPLARYDFPKDPTGTPNFSDDTFTVTPTATGENAFSMTIDYTGENYKNKMLLIKGIYVPDPNPSIRVIRFEKGTDLSDPIDLYFGRNRRGDVILRGDPVIIKGNTVKIVGNVVSTDPMVLGLGAPYNLVVEPVNVAPLYIKPYVRTKIQ